MLLRRLSEYANRLELPPTLYRRKPVRYIIELDQQGRLLNPEPTDTATAKAKRGSELQMPDIQRASGIKPLLLADKADYALGYVGEGAKPKRVAEAHAAFRDLVERCAAATREPAVEAVAAFLRNEPLKQLRLPADFDPGATITFRIGLETFPTDLPSVQAFWATEHAPGTDPDKPATVMQCITCGEERPVLDRLQEKIKGVPGGQSSGTAIISANAPAFESYGLEASLIAPTCARCGERFTKAANDLLSKQENRITIGNVAFVFWTREEVGFSAYGLLSEPKPEEVRNLIESVRSGKLQHGVDETAFYATALSGSGGRTVVRDWLDTTVGEVKQHLATWFQRQTIVDSYGAPGRPMGLFRLAVATVRTADDLPPTTPRALLRGALQGTPLPSDLLYQCVRRSRAEQQVTQPRAALIKLVLLSQHPVLDSEVELVQLNPDHPSAAYQCGRLLAVLEAIQRAALPGINATIVDRFYGTASTAPSSVFGRLVRGAQPHLAKLERDKPGTWRALQRRMEEILGQIGTFPKTLTLEDQGLFALGYYHQRANDRAEAIAARERREAGTTAADIDTIEELPIEEEN